MRARPPDNRARPHPAPIGTSRGALALGRDSAGTALVLDCERLAALRAGPRCRGHWDALARDGAAAPGLECVGAKCL